MFIRYDFVIMIPFSAGMKNIKFNQGHIALWVVSVALDEFHNLVGEYRTAVEFNNTRPVLL